MILQYTSLIVYSMTVTQKSYVATKIIAAIPIHIRCTPFLSNSIVPCLSKSPHSTEKTAAFPEARATRRSPWRTDTHLPGSGGSKHSQLRFWLSRVTL